jgi:hypothetical protein
MQMEGRTDRHIDMMNPTAPFRNFSHAPKSSLTVQSDFLPLFEASNLGQCSYCVRHIVMIGQTVEIGHSI